MEAEWLGRPGWNLRLGAGLDFASTPESGDKDQAEGFTSPALNLRLTRDLGNAVIYAGASRRSRFPSLRELYSGALGRFVPNPDLVPEEQDLFEVGGSIQGRSWELGASAFLQYLNDGIERMSLPGPERQFMRVNRTTIRVPGFEILGSWRPAPDWQIQGQHTVLSARVETESGFDRPAEDRPDYQSRLSFHWQGFSGPGALVEAVVTGARHSADATNEETGLTRLPAHLRWNLRLNWQWDLADRSDGTPVSLDTYFRVENLFDQAAEYQVGLPEPGRVFMVGASLGY
jgi:iron complex outermembrane receptor protein